MTDTTTSTSSPTPDAYQAACDALWAHRDRADALADALDQVRAWRHLQPTAGAAEFAPLDAVLDAVATGGNVAARQLYRPATLPEAVSAYREVLADRRKAHAAARIVWDRIEAAAMREIDRHVHPRTR